MADGAEVFSSLTLPGVSLPVLVPNMQGLDKAITLNVKEIAIFSAGFIY
jgi:hydroxymethylglutaryl-CoA lyase